MTDHIKKIDLWNKAQQPLTRTRKTTRRKSIAHVRNNDPRGEPDVTDIHTRQAKMVYDCAHDAKTHVRQGNVTDTLRSWKESVRDYVPAPRFTLAPFLIEATSPVLYDHTE